MESHRSSRAFDTSPQSEARYPLQPSRCFSDVKVSVIHDARVSHHVVQLEWLDAVCARQRQDFYGLTAQQIATDLHASELLGVTHRITYLNGLIRGLYIERQID